MRSMYAKILLWCFATLVLSLVAFVCVTFFMPQHARGGGMDRWTPCSWMRRRKSTMREAPRRWAPISIA